MIITSLNAFPIHLPFQDAVSDSLGTYYASNHGIVIVETDSDHYGAGEIALAWFGGAHSLCREINDLWRPILVGEDCRNMTYIMKKLQPLLQFSKRHLLAKAAVEMALYDVIGKSLGVPVYQLLGGKMREFIPLTGGVNMGSITDMTAMACKKVGEGYRELKIKVGLDEVHDRAVIQSIRQAIPDEVRLRVDANMAWKNVKTAQLLMDEFYEYGVHIVEQPLSEERLEDLAWLRKHAKPMILLDESVWNVADAKRCLKIGAGDILHVYSNEAGGLNESRRIFELAALYEVPCTIGSMPEARIGAAASLHLGIAMENLSEFSSDVRGYTSYKDDVVHEDLQLENGRLYANDRPGLGLTIDYEKLKHLSVTQ
jgi:L-alanine-DL-glutamate epimerase-like enolase superfamily enzyme